MLTQQLAQSWLDSWDKQQQGYIPEREERFEAVIDALEAGCQRPDPLVIDLGCGPSSLGVRILRRIPRATVVGVDADPLLLELGRAGYGPANPGLRFVETDLAAPGWSEQLGLERAADAAVSSTALHWMAAPDLAKMYAELSQVLSPGGLLLNADHFAVESDSLRAIEDALRQGATRRCFGDNPPQDWKQWWEEVAADPVLQPLLRERDISAHHGSPSKYLAVHVDGLRDAGFTEIGAVWQQGDDRVLCAIRP